MSRRRRQSVSRMITLEIAPMIDVVFLLIIFFMTTAQFAEMTRADVDLPREKGEQEEEAEKAGLVINIDVDGQIIVNTEVITLGELAVLVRAEMEQHEIEQLGPAKVLIRADRNADTAALNEVVAEMQRIGIGAARVATEVPRSPG